MSDDRSFPRRSDDPRLAPADPPFDPTPRFDARQLDPRLGDALRRFARHEIPLFAAPFGFGDDEEYDDVDEDRPLLLNPNEPETFQRLAVNLALHRLDVAAVSYEEAFIEDAEGEFSIDGAAVAVGDEPIFDMDTARAAALEAAESVAATVPGGRPLKPRLLLVRALLAGEAPLDEIERFGRDAQRLVTRDPEEIMSRTVDLGRVAILFAAMREGLREAGMLFEPQIDLVFTFCGEWRRTPRSDAALAVRLSDLRAALPGADIRFQIWGQEELVRAYERVAVAATGVLRDVCLMPLPHIQSKHGPAEGWIGYAPAQSVARLILAPDGLPDPRLFYDNVRHYLGENARLNPGAAGLTRTIESKENAEVVLRHNGVTIVSRGAEFEQDDDGLGDLLLREYQIVNGAQTAFTLYALRDKLEGAFVPVKIVVTEDERIKDGVVLGANTQSAVDRFDMLARRPEIRALQQSFDAAPPSAPEKLWLQRRRDEPFSGKMSPQRIMTPRQLMEGFAAAILGQPHRVHDNAPLLLDDIPDHIFHPNHEPSAYLAVGWLIVAGRRWAERRDLRWADRVGVGRADAYPARFQFLYALFRLVDGYPEDVEIGQGPQNAARYRRIADIFAARDGAALADLAGVIVREAAAGKPLARDLVRRLSFTEAVRMLTDEARPRLHRDAR
ncbi:MAG: AIPR family protein [Pseudomonadota bacterium]